MVFNDGAASQHQPQGAPIGAARDYSAVSAYAIDPATSTVQEAWRFDYGQTILSLFCSSAYESSDGSVLVDYAVAEHFTQTRIVGLDPQHNVVFDFRYPTQLCNTGWNAIPIALDAFVVS